MFLRGDFYVMIGKRGRGMKKDVCGRIARLALIAFALYGITFGALFLRGMYYVQPNADNWRLLPYIVPAARYEQRIHSAAWPGGAQRFSVSISCMDAQGREIRGVTLHEGDLLPLYSDTVYEGNRQTDYFKGWDNSIVKQQGITRIPANILIGPDKRVITQDIRGKELIDKVKQLIEQEKEKEKAAKEAERTRKRQNKK